MLKTALSLALLAMTAPAPPSTKKVGPIDDLRPTDALEENFESRRDHRESVHATSPYENDSMYSLIVNDGASVDSGVPQ